MLASLWLQGRGPWVGFCPQNRLLTVALAYSDTWTGAPRAVTRPGRPCGIVCRALVVDGGKIGGGRLLCYPLEVPGLPDRMSAGR